VRQISRILCAVDFSLPAQAAFEQALALSRACNAELTIVHAVPKDRPFRWHARERMALTTRLRQEATAAGVRVKVSVQHGDPAGVILLHARARRPHLLVIGTQRRAGLSRFRAGSIAETVALRAGCAVLVVPAAAGDAVAQRPTSFREIVCAVDFSPASTGALAHAMALANESHGRLTLVHVARGISSSDLSRFKYRLRVPEFQALTAADGWRRLQDAMAVATRHPARVHARVPTGDPSAEIVRAAADADADLIVVGITSRGAIGRRVFSATATRVIRTAGRLVLAVPEATPRRAGWPSDADRWAMAA
jgi:nucleotide-binding universal stress UspA family protein